MANRAYVSFWTRDHSELATLDRFERFLKAVPLSTVDGGFRSLTVRAIGPSVAPVVEHDFRGVGAKPQDVAALAREYVNADTAFEVEAFWDLWHWDVPTGLWKHGPEPLFLTFQGQEYDDAAALSSGDFQADAGLEHLYTGHAGLLGARGTPSTPADDMEASFLAAMSEENRLEEYHQKTRENIQQLMQWVQAVERALPVERLSLWSEGEENLEARLDEILTLR